MITRELHGVKIVLSSTLGYIDVPAHHMFTKRLSQHLAKMLYALVGSYEKISLVGSNDGDREDGLVQEYMPSLFLSPKTNLKLDLQVVHVSCSRSHYVEWEVGNMEQGTGSREQGQGAGNGEWGISNGERGMGYFCGVHLIPYVYAYLLGRWVQFSSPPW